ncbi:MAG: hypothetical protein P8075_20605 [Deltaproteobacteria bacterium]
MGYKYLDLRLTGVIFTVQGIHEDCVLSSFAPTESLCPQLEGYQPRELIYHWLGPIWRCIAIPQPIL